MSTVLKSQPDYRKFACLSKYTVFFKAGIGGPSSGDIVSIILDYLRIFFSMELFAFKRAQNAILKNLDEVKRIYLYAGYLDCLVTVLNVIEENNCCFAEISDNNAIDFKNMRHPLLLSSVPQTKVIDKSHIITGLNMSGKTTFMKSLGLNQILATGFGFCFAESFTTCVSDVLSSLCINDDILQGKSRYYAEAERLMDIKEKITDHYCLCLIDEILSGTNTDERIYGASLILKNLASYNSLFIAATHDVKIAEDLGDIYRNIYFDGEIKGDKIIFDYMIKDGIVSKKNGLLILKLLDF